MILRWNDPFSDRAKIDRGGKNRVWPVHRIRRTPQDESHPRLELDSSCLQSSWPSSFSCLAKVWCITASFKAVGFTGTAPSDNSKAYLGRSYLTGAQVSESFASTLRSRWDVVRGSPLA